MNEKLIDMNMLFDKLYLQYNKKYMLEYLNIAHNYTFGFLHVKECILISIEMDGYDGWDNFGDEDNDLTIDFCLTSTKKEYKSEDNNDDKLFLSHSIKECEIYHYKGREYISYNALRNWTVFNCININEVIVEVTIDKSFNIITFLKQSATCISPKSTKLINSIKPTQISINIKEDIILIDNDDEEFEL